MPRTLCLCLSLFLLLFADGVAGQQKQRIAVLGFDDAAVESSAASALGGNQDVGTSLADVVVKELIAGGAFSVIERRAIDKVIAEQNLSNSSRADAKTAAAIGRLLGVQAIVMGTVTQFGIEESSVAVGSGALGRVTRGVLGAGKRSNTTAKVGITARMVDTSTGEILTAATGSGESNKASVGGGGYASGIIDMTSSSFQGTVLGEAVNRAARDVASSLNAFGTKRAAVRPAYTGLVADVSGNSLIINAGKQKGVQVGDTIAITRPGRQILDPQTKKVLRTIVEQVATAQVTEVDDASATATVKGKTDVKVGDQIKRAD
jgi:curli biogenesis system outer membrane secretion channel CsgG